MTRLNPRVDEYFLRIDPNMPLPSHKGAIFLSLSCPLTYTVFQLNWRPN